MPSAYVSEAGHGTGISDDKVSSNDPYTNFWHASKVCGMHAKLRGANTQYAITRLT